MWPVGDEAPCVQDPTLDRDEIGGTAPIPGRGTHRGVGGTPRWAVLGVEGRGRMVDRQRVGGGRRIAARHRHPRVRRGDRLARATWAQDRAGRGSAAVGQTCERLGGRGRLRPRHLGTGRVRDDATGQRGEVPRDRPGGVVRPRHRRRQAEPWLSGVSRTVGTTRDGEWLTHRRGGPFRRSANDRQDSATDHRCRMA